jgi:hypothetical protein
MFLDGGFGNGASGAVFDVLMNVLLKLRPIKMFLQYCHYIFYTKMSRFPTVMNFPDHLYTLT